MGVRWESLEDGTFLVSLLACDSESVELEEAGDELEDLEDAGSKGLEEVDSWGAGVS